MRRAAARRGAAVRGGLADVWHAFRRVASPRWRRVVAVSWLVAVVAGVVFGVFAYNGPSESWCSSNTVGCGLGIHLFGTLAAALLAYLSFYRIVTEPRVVLRMLKYARRSPTRLFRWLDDGTDYEKPIGREEFVSQLADDVAHSQLPHIVVGDGGAGKTTVLVALAAELGRRGMIPVPVTVRELHRRDAANLDFGRWAQEAFSSQAFHSRPGSRVVTNEGVEKAWRKLRPRVVLLVDDLEKVQRGREGLRPAFAAARAERLMVIAASRLDGIPSALEASRVELDALSGSAAVGQIFDCGQRGPAKDRCPTKATVDRLVRSADVVSTPYFMRLAMRLADEGRLPRDFPASRAGARLSLLEAYHASLRSPTGERSRATTRWLSPPDRDGVLVDLERLACQSLGRRPPGAEAVGAIPEAVEPGLSAQRWPGSDQPAVPDTIRICGRERLVEGGERMKIIRARHADDLRFTEQVLQAYFASRLLRGEGGAQVRTQLLERNPGSPFLAMALVLAAAASPPDAGAGSTGAHQIGEALLDCAREKVLSGAVEDRATGIRLITAAVEVAALAGPRGDSLAERAVGMVRTAEPALERNDAPTRRLKLRLIEELSSLGGDRSVGALLRFESDPDYLIRWHAIVGVTSAGNPGFRTVAQTAAAAIAAVKAIPAQAHGLDDNGPHEPGTTVGRLKPVAWMLPALHSAAVRDGRPGDARQLEEHIREIVAAAERSGQHGVRASLAQGFKLDAVLVGQSGSGVPLLRERLFDLLDGTTFWYTKVILIQAITLRLIAMRLDAGAGDRARAVSPAAPGTSYLGPAVSAAEAERRLERFLRRDALHPYVEQAGELCRRALKDARRGRSWRGYIWTGDEVEVITRPPMELKPRALHLVGDMALLLNLNEQDRSADERAYFGDHPELPACLKGGDRTRILEDQGEAHMCLRDCPFSEGSLCPDRAPRWSEDDVFGQAQYSRRLHTRGFCRRLRHTAGPRLFGVASGRRLRAFWAEMERRAPL